MSHKKTADDNPQINFCGYPLIYFQSQDFKKLVALAWPARTTREVLALRVEVVGKERQPICSVPSQGDGEIARISRGVNHLFEKISKFFPVGPAGRISKVVEI